MRARWRRGLLTLVSSATGLAAGLLGHHLVTRRSKSAAPKPRYRIDPKAGIAEELRRVGAAQLNLALNRLRAHDDGDDEAVHDARKALKRTRALLRLSRDLLGRETFQRENHNLRDAGLALSGTRDSQVLLQTLHKLGLNADKLLAGHPVAGVGGVQIPDGRPAAVPAILGTRDRLAGWPLPARGDLRALAPGFRRIYRQGRRALALVEEDPNDERWHELRKRAKDMWHIAQLLEAAQPERMGNIAGKAHRLSDLLGDDHDLVVLQGAAQQWTWLGEADRERLAAAIRGRRGELHQSAVVLARRLYRRKPAKLLRWLKLA